IGLSNDLWHKIGKYAGELLKNFGYNDTKKIIANMNRKNHMKEKLNKMLKEFNLFNNDESEKKDKNSDLEIDEEEEIQIPQHEVYVLIMEKDIDLKIFDDESEDLGNNESEDFKKRRHSLQRVILRIAEEFDD
ncbi:hypothetical protein RhiirC2_711196, partial [Rhizophagus irregularis]